MADYDYIFKILVIGNSGVGKTSFFRRFTANEFSESQIVTIGVDFSAKSLEICIKNVSSYKYGIHQG